MYRNLSIPNISQRGGCLLSCQILICGDLCTFRQGSPHDVFVDAVEYLPSLCQKRLSPSHILLQHFWGHWRLPFFSIRNLAAKRPVLLCQRPGAHQRLPSRILSMRLCTVFPWKPFLLFFCFFHGGEWGLWEPVEARGSL